MARGIIDLIQENKRRFYAGEIRNSFYEDSYISKDRKRQNVVIVDNTSEVEQQSSFWMNLKKYGHKFSEDLFYEPGG